MPYGEDSAVLIGLRGIYELDNRRVGHLDSFNISIKCSNKLIVGGGYDDLQPRSGRCGERLTETSTVIFGAQRVADQFMVPSKLPGLCSPKLN